MDLMCLTAAASTLSGWRAGEPAGDVPAHVKVAGHQADPDAVQQNEGEQRGEVNLWSQQQAQGGGESRVGGACVVGGVRQPQGYC